VSVVTVLAEMNFRKFGSSVEILLLYIGAGKMHTCTGADIAEAVPFIHTVLADTNLDIETIVVLAVDLTLRQIFLNHILMRLFTCLNLCDKSATGFGKVTHATSDKVFPPLMLAVIGAWRTFASAYAEKDTDLSSWPFIANGLVQNLRAWVVFTSTFVQESALTNLNRLECQGGSRSGASSLPDVAVIFG
jgi:hypothetical protein